MEEQTKATKWQGTADLNNPLPVSTEEPLAIPGQIMFTAEPLQIKATHRRRTGKRLHDPLPVCCPNCTG